MEANPSGRRGQMLVTAVVALAVLSIIAALTIDVGHMFAERALLQNAADAGALAAGEKLLEERYDEATEETARSNSAVEGAIIVGLNTSAPSCEVRFGSYDDGVFTEEGVETEATAVEVAAYRDDTAPGGPLSLFFSSVMGLDSVEVGSSAVCDMFDNIYAIGNDLRPFGVPSGAIAGVQPGETFVFNIAQGEWQIEGEEEVSPGNFGWLDLDGGANSNTELADWVQNGYPELFVIDPEVGYIWLEGTPGLRASLQDELESVVGRKLFMCVYDTIEGEGANTTFRVVTFACVTITEVELTGNDKHITCRLERLSNVPVCLVGFGEPTNNLCGISLVQ